MTLPHLLLSLLILSLIVWIGGAVTGQIIVARARAVGNTAFAANLIPFVDWIIPHVYIPAAVTAASSGEVLDRRADAVRTAQALIVERGFEGLRVREVARRVGINHATLLYYFPTKEALIRGVVEDIVARLDRVPAEAAALSPENTLRAHFAHVLGQMRAAPAQFTVLSELFLRAGRDPGLREVLAETDRAWRAFLVPLLGRGVHDGAFRHDLDVEAAATLIMSTLKGFAFELTLTPERAERALAQLERWVAEDA